MLPWIAFLPKLLARGRKLSELESRSIKEVDTKRVDVDVSTSLASTSETDLATQTASTGKDMYLAEARVSWSKGSTGTPDINIRLFVNGVQKEEKEWEEIVQNDEDTYTFLTKGVKVTTGQIIKITAQSSSTDAIAFESKLLLWEETTSATPQIPPL